MTNVRVRFAPAPTGMMHLGNVRAACINFLFAQSSLDQLNYNFNVGNNQLNNIEDVVIDITNYSLFLFPVR